MWKATKVARKVELTANDCHIRTCTLRKTASPELFLANNLRNIENVPSLELLPQIFSHFQRIASTCTSSIVISE